MSYGNYVQGAVDTTNNGYNLLISGAPSGYTQSGLMIGGDTATTYGVRVSKDATNNAYLDMRGDASNSMALRYKDNTSGTVTSMLNLSNDSALTGTGYGATVNGRVNASAYYVGQADTRAPANAGVYMAMDGSNVGKFSINKGTGTGGFQFNTYNANGTLAQSNLNLLASGIVQAAYYTATGNAADSEDVAISGFDANGNLIRNYAANARFRAVEARLTALETDLVGNVPSKVNEIITRLNGLNFFSQNIATIATFAPPSVPAVPTGVSATADSATSVRVSFTPGDNQATLFTVTANPGGITATGTASPITVTGLTTGTSYTFTVMASDNMGNSSASASATASPSSPTTTLAAGQHFNFLGKTFYVKNVSGTAISQFGLVISIGFAPGQSPAEVCTTPAGWTINGQYNAYQVISSTTLQPNQTVSFTFPSTLPVCTGGWSWILNTLFKTNNNSIDWGSGYINFNQTYGTGNVNIDNSTYSINGLSISYA